MNADMLVKLYELPDLAPYLQEQEQQGVTIRRTIPPEKFIVVNWVLKHFSPYWGSETEVAYSNLPPTCFIAVEQEQVIGFACYDSTRKGFFGPTGVDETKRGRNIGTALLVACMHAMLWDGYGYAIIGAAGPQDFYAKTIGAVTIPDSWPGVYRGMLPSKK
jgi:hypothetical protein